MTKKIYFWFMVGLGIFLPATLMAIYPEVMAMRAYIMALGGLYLFYVLKKHRASLGDLGITRHNFVVALRQLAFPTIILLAVMALTLHQLPHDILTSWLGNDPQVIPSIYLRIFLYIIFSVPLQELVFRGFMVWRGRDIFGSEKHIFWMVFIIFVGVHLPFFSPLMLVVAAYMGYVYTQNYIKYGNLYAIMISHALAGSLLLLLRNYYLPY